MAREAGAAHTPIRSLTTRYVIVVIVGMVIGAGIFRSPALVAANAGSEQMVYLLWITGGLISLAGALCYSELGINFPSSGGEYVYLTEAYGPTWGFMDGWISFFAGFSAGGATAAGAGAWGPKRSS